jgi:ADP-L-glycero-D-manno-heptose 6-epimerase
MIGQWCLVTGGAGFVGARLIRTLSDLGHDRILLVDSYQRRPDKLRGAATLRVGDFLDYFAVNHLDVAGLDARLPPLAAIFHIGAWSDVLESNVTKVLRYNFEHSRKWIELGQVRRVPVIYASSSALYGTSGVCRTDVADCERPFNAYGYSKLLVDRWVQSHLPTFTAPVVGLRFFNVFGPGEDHKRHNASIPTRFFNFLRERGYIELFEGDIRRDYVEVTDVARVIVDAWQSRRLSGVYNLGSGVAISHREIAIEALMVARGAGLSVKDDAIRLIPIPEALKGRFQFYTKADAVPAWIRTFTADPLSKMTTYWKGIANTAEGAQ